MFVKIFQVSATEEWVNKVHLLSFHLKTEICPCMISACTAKHHLDVTTVFTYSHANTPLSQSEGAYYLTLCSYFINKYEDHCY